MRKANRPGDVAALHWLRVGDISSIADLLKFRSISQVARIHGVSPSQLSRVLSRVESSLGVSLMSRDTRSMQLTESGKRLAQSFEGCLQFLSEAVNPSAPKQTITLGVAQLFSDASVGLFQELRGGERWELQELTSFQISEPPALATCDVMITDSRDPIAKTWDVRVLGQSRWALIDSITGNGAGPVVTCESGIALPDDFQAAEVHRVPRLHQAFLLAEKVKGRVWAPEWAVKQHWPAVDFESAAELSAMQQVVMACHPDRIRSSTAVALSEVWRSALWLQAHDGAASQHPPRLKVHDIHERSEPGPLEELAPLPRSPLS